MNDAYGNRMNLSDPCIKCALWYEVKHERFAQNSIETAHSDGCKVLSVGLKLTTVAALLK